MRIWLVGLGLGLAALGLPLFPLLGTVAHVSIGAAGCVLLLARRQLLMSGLLVGLAWGAHSNLTLLDARLPQCAMGLNHELVVEIRGDPEQPANSAASGASVRFRALYLVSVRDAS